MSRISKIGVAAFVALSSAIGAPLTMNLEAVKLAPYYDSIGKLTWCAGETEVGYKNKFTFSECSTLFKMRYGYYSLRTAEYYNSVAREIVTPEMHASFVDMSYNIGLGGVKNSSMIRLINQGDYVGACKAILLYKRAGKIKDCSLTKGQAKGCYGVWDRRLQMSKFCLKGM